MSSNGQRRPPRPRIELVSPTASEAEAAAIVAAGIVPPGAGGAPRLDAGAATGAASPILPLTSTSDVFIPPRGASFDASENVIAGNVIGYGAKSGSMFLRGVVGERFFVRNSGATAVVEGVGDHALEYMTGGRAVILGATGRNIAAGMSGGIGYVLDLARHRVNGEMVDIEPLDGEDAQWLRDVLVRYTAETDSTVAAALLADWGRWSERFSVIMPRDYRRALDARRAAEAAGTDVDRAVMEAARG